MDTKKIKNQEKIKIKMIISIIVAMDKNRVIGKDNKMPWHLSSDLKRFKQLTMGKPIIMGRKTFESIGKPLPGRINIILTKDANYKQEGCIVVHSVDEALKFCEGNNEVMVIGGAKVYMLFLPMTKKIYLTLVDGEYEGDTYFPEIDMKKWEEVRIEEHFKDDNNPYSFSFIELGRKED